MVFVVLILLYFGVGCYRLGESSSRNLCQNEKSPSQAPTCWDSSRRGSEDNFTTSFFPLLHGFCQPTPDRKAGCNNNYLTTASESSLPGKKRTRSFAGTSI